MKWGASVFLLARLLSLSLAADDYDLLDPAEMVLAVEDNGHWKTHIEGSEYKWYEHQAPDFP